MERKANLLRKPDRKVKAAVAAGLGLLLTGCGSTSGEGVKIITPSDTTAPSGSVGFGEGHATDPTTNPVTHEPTKAQTHPTRTHTHPFTTPATTAAAPGLIKEQVDNHQGAKVFEDNRGTALKNPKLPSVLEYGTSIEVKCVENNESGGMASVTGFYVIGAGELAGKATVADVYTNGGPLGNTDSPGRDERVPVCPVPTAAG